MIHHYLNFLLSKGLPSRKAYKLVDEREIHKGVDETHLRILYMASTTNPARKKRDVDINVRVSDILQDVMWKGKFM